MEEGFSDTQQIVQKYHMKTMTYADDTQKSILCMLLT